MALTERLALVVTADADGAVRGLNQVGGAAKGIEGTETRLSRLGSTLDRAVTPTTIAMGAAFTLAARNMVNSAAELTASVGGTEALVAGASGAIEAFAGWSVQSAGLSDRAARELTSRIGSLLQGFGFAREESAEWSVQLAKLGADLSATFAGTTEEAV